MASRVGTQGAQLVVFLVAARYLSPEDFGVFTLFFAFQVLFVQLVQLGWPEFVASWEGAREVDTQAFTMAALGGGCAALLGSIGAAVMLRFPNVAPYALLQLTLSLPLAGAGITAVLEGWLLRSGRGAALAKIMLVSEFGGAAAAIFGLTQGWGLISLGFGKLVGQGLLFLGSFSTARWFPRLRLQGPGTAAIATFQKNLLVSKLMWYLEQYAATLALGLFLGPHAVGLYRAAERMVGAVAELVFAPARVVSWMTLRPVVDSESPHTVGPALARETERFLTLLLLAATPVFLGMASVSHALVSVLLGEKWLAATPVVSLLCVAYLISVMSVVMPSLFSLRQQSGQVLKLSLIMGTASVIALLAFAPFGVVATALGEVVAAIVIACAVGASFAKEAGVNVIRAVRLAFPSFAGSALMVLGLSAFSRVCGTLTSDVRLQLGIEVALGALIFMLTFTLLGGWRRIVNIQMGSERPLKH